MWGFVTSRIGILLIGLALLTFAGLWIKALHSDLTTVRAEREAYKLSHAQCETDKIIASEVSNEYQKKLTDLDTQLRDLRRVYRDTCVPINRPSGRRHAAAPEGELREPDGIEAEWLIDYAGDAERVRLRLLGCQDFLNRLGESD